MLENLFALYKCYFVEFIFFLFQNSKCIILVFFSLKGLNWETVAVQQYAIMSDAGLLKQSVWGAHIWAAYTMERP